MWSKILIEIVIAILLLTLGSSFWAILKSRGHLQSVFADEGELRRLVEFLTPAKIIDEGQTIKPMFETYLQNILFFEKAHFAALNKTRNMIFIASLVLMGISYFLGLPYLIASLAVFILPSFSGIPASAKNNNMTHVHTVLLNIYKWSKTDHVGCAEYCEDESSNLKNVFRIVDALG